MMIYSARIGSAFPAEIMESDDTVDLVYNDYIAHMFWPEENRAEVVVIERSAPLFGSTEAVFRKILFDRFGEWTFGVTNGRGRSKRMGRIGADTAFYRRALEGGAKMVRVPKPLIEAFERPHPERDNPCIGRIFEEAGNAQR